MFVKRSKLLAVVVAALLLLVACGGGSGGDGGSTPSPSGGTGGSGGAGSGAAQELVIGGSLPLTGDFQQIGTMTKRGYELAAKHAGDINGYRIVLEIQDDQQNPTNTSNIWNSIIADKQAVAMLGPYGSTTSIVASDVAEKYGVPHVLNSASSYKVHERDTNYLYNAYSLLSIVRDPFIAEMVQHLGAKTVAALGEDGEFGTEGVRRLSDLADQHGFTITDSETIKGGTPDFSPTLLKFKDKNPEVFVGYFYINDWVKILRQSREIDFNPDYFIIPIAGDGIDEKFLGPMGKDADYVLEVNVWMPTMESPQNEKFMADFREMFGEDPDYNAAAGYVAAQVLFDALARASDPTDRDSVNEALKASNADTLFGTLTFDEDGRAFGANLFFTQTIDGKPVIVYPNDVAETEAVPTPPWSTR